MNRSYRIIPVYSGDVSGAASALFEMGGMVVIHDPSGCNSTYNTHDETRWYDTDSLIYISGLSNTDAIMGDDEKLIREVEEASEELHPAFIALTSSPVPYMNGTDFPAIARLISCDTGIPAFFVPSNGMHDYVYGAGNAFREAAGKLLPGEQPVQKNGKVNLLGVTPLDFAWEGAAESLRKALEDQGLYIQSCWAMGDSREHLLTAAEASVNLVVSAVGLPMAEYMEETFGIPWVAGCPVGAFTGILAEAVKQTAVDGISRIPYLDRPSDAQECVYLVGEPVTMGSLAAAVSQETGKVCRVICPVEASKKLTGAEDFRTDGEEEAEQALAGASVIIADPFYRFISPSSAEFLDLPQLAFSGRAYLKKMKDFTKLSFDMLKKGL